MNHPEFLIPPADPRPKVQPFIRPGAYWAGEPAPHKPDARTVIAFLLQLRETERRNTQNQVRIGGQKSWGQIVERAKLRKARANRRGAILKLHTPGGAYARSISADCTLQRISPYGASDAFSINQEALREDGPGSPTLMEVAGNQLKENSSNVTIRR